MSEFKNDLSGICEDLLLIDNVDVLASEYNTKLIECLDRHAPVLTHTFVSRPKRKWFDNSLRDSKKKRRKAERTWRRSNLPSDEKHYKIVKNSHVSKLNRAHTEHYQRY